MFYHFVLEIISVIIVFTIFLVGWNSRRYTADHSLLFISIAYMVVGVLDIFHMITYNGTVFFDYIVSDIHAKLCISARFIEGISILISLLISKFKKFINLYWIFGIYISAASFLLFDILYYQTILPACFIEGIGLTKFKIYGEYIIILLFLSSVYILLRKKYLVPGEIRSWVLMSLVLSIFAEIFLNLSSNPYELTHMFGHIVKVIALIYIYKALVEGILKKPYNNLFQQYTYSQNKLIASASLLTTMVHDLKNPLSNIRALSQLGKIAKTNEKKEAYFTKIIKNVDQLNEMLNKIMGSISGEKFIVYELGNIIEEVVEEIRPVCSTKNIKLFYEIDETIPVLLEKSMFKRAIYNILMNGINAMGDNGRLDLFIERRWNNAMIIIKDNGPGIPESIQESIFQPFVTSNGTGLGLYMVNYTITNIHKGKIWFDTEKGRGTTFYIELPLLNNNSKYSIGSLVLKKN